MSRALVRRRDAESERLASEEGTNDASSLEQHGGFVRRFDEKTDGLRKEGERKA